MTNPSKKQFLYGITGLALVISPFLTTIKIEPEVTSIVATKSTVISALKNEELNLNGFQLPNGLIQTFKNGEVADPYFGLYALWLAKNFEVDTKNITEKFIKWGLSAQTKEGNFEKYCKKTALEWRACGKSDSDDATLARWIYLLSTEASNYNFNSKEIQESINKADKFLMSLKMSNGVYSVFPKNTKGYAGYALFKDNVEVYSVFIKLANYFGENKETEKAAMYAKRAFELKKAMKYYFGDNPWKMKRFALGANYDKERFYPHAVAIPFGWSEGYFEEPSIEEWEKWLTKYKKAWDLNAKVDFPWGTIALSALQFNQKNIAYCWKEKYTINQKNQERWNILEEVSFQILQKQKVTEKKSCN